MLPWLPGYYVTGIPSLMSCASGMKTRSGAIMHLVSFWSQVTPWWTLARALACDFHVLQMLYLYWPIPLLSDRVQGHRTLISDNQCQDDTVIIPISAITECSRCLLWIRRQSLIWLESVSHKYWFRKPFTAGTQLKHTASSTCIYLWKSMSQWDTRIA